MADISITPADVVPGTGATFGSGTAGATITAGQPLYLDSATNTLKLADANASSATATCVGIASHGAASGQPIVYQTAGLITISAVMTAAKIYVLSATAGGIAPAADLATGWRTTVLGVALTTSSMRMLLYNSDTANA